MLLPRLSAEVLFSRDNPGCSNVPPNQTCFDIYDRSESFPIDILYLNPGSNLCPSPTKILLVLLAYILTTAAITLLFTLIRATTSIRNWYGEVAAKPRDIYVLIPMGSLVIQILFTVGSGRILASEDPRSDSGMLTILWFTRPSATIFFPVILSILRDPTENWELLAADFIYRSIAIGGFCAAAHASKLLDGEGLLEDATIAIPGLAESYIPYVKAGAALGIVASLCSLLFIAASALGTVRARLWTKWRRFWWLSYSYILVTHVIYVLASWFLWTGLVRATPQGFCPSNRALGKLAALCVSEAIVENLWRAFVLLFTIGDPDSGCPRWIVGVGETVEKAMVFVAGGGGGRDG